MSHKTEVRLYRRCKELQEFIIRTVESLERAADQDDSGWLYDTVEAIVKRGKALTDPEATPKPISERGQQGGLFDQERAA